MNSIHEPQDVAINWNMYMSNQIYSILPCVSDDIAKKSDSNTKCIDAVGK